MKVVVTGETGFINSTLRNKLVKDHQVFALIGNPEKASALFHKTVKIIKWNTNMLDGRKNALKTQLR